MPVLSYDGELTFVGKVCALRSNRLCEINTKVFRLITFIL